MLPAVYTCHQVLLEQWLNHACTAGSWDPPPPLLLIMCPAALRLSQSGKINVQLATLSLQALSCSVNRRVALISALMRR
jgi:hypothetical protein